MVWQTAMDRLRAELFVGRVDELGVFDVLLQAGSAPGPVALLVTGAAGMGKTTLLRHMEATARVGGHATDWLDAADLASAEALADACTEACARLAASPEAASQQPALWFVDGLPTALVTPLFERVFPRLPDSVRLVASSIDVPPLWQADPVLRRLVRALPLGPLSPDDSRALLRVRGAPEASHDAILGFAYGHPLALALAADVAALDPALRLSPLDTPDLIGALAERFVRDIPDDAREAVTALALVRTLDEPLLAALLGTDDARERFAWLRHLAVTQQHGSGIALHPLVQDVLAQDARWRDPDRYEALHARARRVYARRLAGAAHGDFASLLADYLFLLRDNPLVRPFFDQLVRPMRGGTAPRWRERPATAADTDALVAMTERHEGPESAAWARRWLAAMPNAAHVYEDLSGEAPRVAGFLLPLALTASTPRHGDPAAEAAWAVAEAVAPLRPHEHALLFRFWMADETYQSVSPVQALIFVETVRQYMAPGLAMSFLPVAHHGFWDLVMAVVGFDRIGDADFVVDGRSFHVFGHDWRRVTPERWLERISQFGLRAAPPPLAAPRRLLSRADFDAAVDAALRCARRPDQLAATDLADTRLVTAGGDRGQALQTLLRESIEAMRAVPRTRPLANALDASFFSDIPTQERMAEHLGLPFSTYRRHRRRGVEALADALWERESQAPARPAGGA